MTITTKIPTKRRYRRGDLLRVRSADDILSTLDSDGTVDGLLFMPEMLKFAGREFHVQASAHKTCDGAGSLRQMDRSVHLEGLRCDGSAHGGCQAGCLLYWREEWLAPAAEPHEPIPATTDIAQERLASSTRTTDSSGESVYRCQATDVLQASRPLSRYNPIHYVRDLTSGNVSFRALLTSLCLDAFKKYQYLSKRYFPRWLLIRDGRPYPFYQGTGTGTRTPVVDLSPRQPVAVRTKDEIMATLNSENRNRGMWFDQEMIPYCGTGTRVERHVQRIIDESTGKMIKLSDCVVLENVVCQGLYHGLCQRSIPQYWRSAWLRPMDGRDVE